MIMAWYDHNNSYKRKLFIGIATYSSEVQFIVIMENMVVCW